MRSEKSGIRFDIHFSKNGTHGFQIKGLTELGEKFLRNVAHGKHVADVYTIALEQGLHVSFEDAETRNTIA